MTITKFCAFFFFWSRKKSHLASSVWILLLCQQSAISYFCQEFRRRKHLRKRNQNLTNWWIWTEMFLRKSLVSDILKRLLKKSCLKMLPKNKFFEFSLCQKVWKNSRISFSATFSRLWHVSYGVGIFFEIMIVLSISHYFCYFAL